MTALKTIFAICGSTRKHSVNLGLLTAVAHLYRDQLHIIIYQKIDELPHFNPDVDNGNSPDVVNNFRKQLQQADGVLICTPEYAMGVPGTLKNAIDWTVSSAEFSHKPTALITAGLSGEKGHKALMETLNIIEADIPETSQLIIQFAKTKIKDDSIIDDETRRQVISVMDSLLRILNQKKG